jgi:hypothetical protein
VAAAADFPGAEYDLVAIFDALHDMPDPLGAARHIHQALGFTRVRRAAETPFNLIIEAQP